MKKEFNEVAANIPIADGWAVHKIHYTEDAPVVLLDCGKAGQKGVSVRMDLDKAMFIDGFPQPFTRRPPEELAQKIRDAIKPPQP